jgi:hypothetical protein
MTMVALDAPRKKVVPVGSLEARWMVDEGEVADYLKDARKHPKMQALMADQADARIEDEKISANRLAEDKARRAIRV